MTDTTQKALKEILEPKMFEVFGFVTSDSDGWDQVMEALEPVLSSTLSSLEQETKQSYLKNLMSIEQGFTDETNGTVDYDGFAQEVLQFIELESMDVVICRGCGHDHGREYLINRDRETRTQTISDIQALEVLQKEKIRQIAKIIDDEPFNTKSDPIDAQSWYYMSIYKKVQHLLKPE